MKLLRLLFLPVFYVFIVGNSTLVLAAGSGAFRVELPDAGALGKGTSFVGEANTPAAVYYNPAGLTQIKKTQFSIGTTVLAPAADVKRFNGDKVQMRREVFNIPHAYLAAPLNNKFALGLGASSYFGLGTTWADDSFTRYGNTKSALENQDYMLSLAYKLTDQLSIAVGPDFERSHVNKQKKLYQGGTDGNLELDATSKGFGFRIATHYKVNEQHSFGLMYRSPIQHKYKGKADLDNLNNTAVIDVNADGTPDIGYQTAFGGTSYQTNFTEKYKLPPSIVLGYSFKPTTKLTLNADLEWMDWSTVKQDAINWVDETSTLPLAVLNSGNPASRNWKSVFSYSFGLEYAATEKLRLRGGYYHHNSPIPDDNWESSIPDSDSHGFTTGFGYDISKNFSVDMAYSLLIYEHRKIQNGINPSSAADYDGKYSQIMNMGLLTFTYKL